MPVGFHLSINVLILLAAECWLVTTHIQIPPRNFPLLKGAVLSKLIPLPDPIPVTLWEPHSLSSTYSNIKGDLSSNITCKILQDPFLCCTSPSELCSSPLICRSPHHSPKTFFMQIQEILSLFPREPSVWHPLCTYWHTQEKTEADKSCAQHKKELVEDFKELDQSG